MRSDDDAKRRVGEEMAHERGKNKKKEREKTRWRKSKEHVGARRSFFTIVFFELDVLRTKLEAKNIFLALLDDVTVDAAAAADDDFVLRVASGILSFTLSSLFTLPADDSVDLI